MNQPSGLVYLYSLVSTTFLPLKANLDVHAALGFGLEVEVGGGRPQLERLLDLVVDLSVHVSTCNLSFSFHRIDIYGLLCVGIIKYRRSCL